MIIEDTSNIFAVVWDLGRRCTYSCSYCPPHRNNKISPMATFDELCTTLEHVVEYTELYDSFRKSPLRKKISFTGGEPTANPAFFDFLDHMRERYPKISRSLTTNGWFGEDKLKQIKRSTNAGTISYHCEATKKQKDRVIQNAISLKGKYKVNVMFHKDYFDECIDVCGILKENGVRLIPRIIGDELPTEELFKLGYAHKYSDDQMKWFRKYWEAEGQQVAKTGDSNSGLGRPCCGGRCFNIDGKESKFLSSTNFKGWYCMINWYGIFLNQELDRIWTHQTCGVNLNGKVEPIGKISEFDTIIDKLADDLFVKRQMPMIRCPKSFCGCGMCITKSDSEDSIKEIFDKHTKNITFKSVDIQESNHHIDITTKKEFDDC